MKPMNSKKLDQVLDMLAKIGQKHIKKSESLLSSINIKDEMIKISAKEIVLDPIEKKLRTGYVHAISKEQPYIVKKAVPFTALPPTAEEIEKEKKKRPMPGSAMSKYPSGSESNTPYVGEQHGGDQVPASETLAKTIGRKVIASSKALKEVIQDLKREDRVFADAGDIAMRLNQKGQQSNVNIDDLCKTLADNGITLIKKAQVPGGLAEGKPDTDFNADALAEGTAVEMEHTGDTEKSKDIAKDHLTEDPDYYTKLKKMEAKGSGKFQEGDKVHIDTDNKEWGRVVTDGTVLEDQGNSCLVNAESIKADIIVPKSDIHVKASLDIEAISAKEEFKVGDVFDTQGHTNMAGKVTIREISGNTLKFIDENGVNYSGMARSQVRILVNGGSWKKITQQEHIDSQASLDIEAASVEQIKERLDSARESRSYNIERLQEKGLTDSEKDRYEKAKRKWEKDIDRLDRELSRAMKLERKEERDEKAREKAEQEPTQEPTQESVAVQARRKAWGMDKEAVWSRATELAKAFVDGNTEAVRAEVMANNELYTNVLAILQERYPAEAREFAQMIPNPVPRPERVQSIPRSEEDMKRTREQWQEKSKGQPGDEGVGVEASHKSLLKKSAGQFEEGDRIELVHTSNIYSEVLPGTQGTVSFMDDAGTVHVDWDDGGQLSIMPETGDVIKMVAELVEASKIDTLVITAQEPMSEPTFELEKYMSPAEYQELQKMLDMREKTWAEISKREERNIQEGLPPYSNIDYSEVEIINQKIQQYQEVAKSRKSGETLPTTPEVGEIGKPGMPELPEEPTIPMPEEGAGVLEKRPLPEFASRRKIMDKQAVTCEDFPHVCRNCKELIVPAGYSELTFMNNKIKPVCSIADEKEGIGFLFSFTRSCKAYDPIIKEMVQKSNPENTETIFEELKERGEKTIIKKAGIDEKKCPVCGGNLEDIGSYKWDCPKGCLPTALELGQIEDMGKEKDGKQSGIKKTAEYENVSAPKIEKTESEKESEENEIEKAKAICSKCVDAGYYAKIGELHPAHPYHKLWMIPFGEVAHNPKGVCLPKNNLSMQSRPDSGENQFYSSTNRKLEVKDKKD